MPPCHVLPEALERRLRGCRLENFHPHDVRHVSLTFVAPGAYIEELKKRGGHKTEREATRYQAASEERDHIVATEANKRLAEL